MSLLMKNLLRLHEAMVVALIGLPKRQGTFDEIAAIVEKRNLFPERAGNITLAKQMELRAFQSSGRYAHLFEKVDDSGIRLKGI